MYRQQNGRFFDVSNGSGADIQINSRGVVAADFDGDGDLDIVINNYRDHATLLRNNLRRNNWIQLRLQGTRSNRDAVGARVVLHTRLGTQMRTVRGGSGFLSDEPLTLSFGLKDATREKASRKVLRSLANETGGRAYFIEDLTELGEIYAAIQQELRSRYLLAYQSTSTKDPSEFRLVEVDVDQKGAEIRTMSGYYP